MTHNQWVLILAIVGTLAIIRFTLPIYEAIWFSMVTTAMVMIGAGWASIHPRSLYKLAGFFLRNISSRLWGENEYCVKQELDGWVFEPPFKIYRSEKK